MEDTAALISDLKKTISNLEVMVKRLLAENEALKKKLGIKKTSSNSSLPPSHDISRKNQSLREKSILKTGGQKGHAGTTLKFTGIPDEIVEVKPDFCTSCGRDLSEAPSEVKQTTHKIDVKITTFVTEFHHHAVSCRCGQVHSPDFEPPVRYGQTITALSGYLNAAHYVSFKRTASFIQDVFHIPLSEGTVAAMVSRCGEAAQSAAENIRRKIENSPVVGADETGTRLNGKCGWFWVFQTPHFTYITFDKSRKQKVLTDVFPNGLPNSTLVSDRYAAYGNINVADRQFCLAHLLLEVNYLEALEKTQWATQFGQWLKDAFAEKPDENIQQRLDQLLAQTLTCATPKTHTFLKSLAKNAAALTTFLYRKNVPPDNNASERAVRHVKSKTKICVQFKTEKGANQYAAMRSVMDTARKNEQPVWNVFVELVNSNLSNST